MPLPALRLVALVVVIAVAVYMLWSKLAPDLACPGQGTFSTVVGEGTAPGQTLCVLKDTADVDKTSGLIATEAGYSNVLNMVDRDKANVIRSDSAGVRYFNPSAGTDGWVGDGSGQFTWTDKLYPPAKAPPTSQGCPPDYATLDTKYVSKAGESRCRVVSTLDTRDSMVNANLDLDSFFRHRGYHGMVTPDNQFKFQHPDGWDETDRNYFFWTAAKYPKTTADIPHCPDFAMHVATVAQNPDQVVCALNPDVACKYTYQNQAFSLPYSGYVKNVDSTGIGFQGICQNLQGFGAKAALYHDTDNKGPDGNELYDFNWRSGDGWQNAKDATPATATFLFTPMWYKADRA